MGRRRASGWDRVFVVAGDLRCDDRIKEIALHGVMTWPSEEQLRRGLLSGMPMTSKELTLADTPGGLSVGMYLPVEADESWLVRLGKDRPVGPFRDGDRLTVLASEFSGSGGALVWDVRPQADQRWVVRQTGSGLVLEDLDRPLARGPRVLYER